MREPVQTTMTVQAVVNKLVQNYIDNGTDYGLFQVAVEVQPEGQPKRHIVVDVTLQCREYLGGFPPGLLQSSGVPDQPRMPDLERGDG